MTDDRRIGPFTLCEPIGLGGMGRVYRAEHRALGVSVAIKAVLGADTEVAQERLRAEVEAMAGLDHPHIGRVFDQGVAEGGVLGAGTPWFAMELVGSTLRRELQAVHRWSLMAPYLFQLLDALAHAHARGVIHRDLKMGNVLVGRSDDLRPGLKLVDFGIAAVQGGSVELVGTPTAMAPEQWTQGLADIGPWTDVFALGVLLWRLVTGERPTGDAQGPGIFLRQRSGSFEPFRPRFEVPDGLEEWLYAAMAFDPGDRYLCAPDALAALAGLGAIEPGVGGTAVPLPPQAPERTESSHLTVPVSQMMDTASSSALSAPPPSPVPLDWRAPLPPPTSVHLAGAGLSLLPWREVPFVGQEGARESLWLQTRRAQRGEALRVAIEGPPGVGASALGRWWVHRLRTASGTLAVVADGSLDALVDALLQPLGLPGDRAGRATGLVRHGAGFRPAHDALYALDGPCSQALRVGAVLEVLRALGRTRPVAVFVDSDDADVHAFVARCDELGPEVMVAVRVRREVPEDFEPLAVRPMPEPELSMLLDQLLPLAPGLHRAVLDASGGRPARLRALVLQMVPSLVASPAGFDGEVPPGTDDPLDALDDRADADLEVLEVAVATGASVQRSIWVRAASITPTHADGLAEVLVRRGLATPMPWGLAVAPELVDALQRRARAAGRWARHHRSLAETLGRWGGDPLEVGRSWMVAGEAERAARGVLEQGSRLLRDHGATVTIDALEDLQEALEEVSEVEEVHGRLAVRLALLRQESSLPVTASEAEGLQSWALERGWYDTAAGATRLWAWVVTLDQDLLCEVYASADQRFLSRASPAARARLLGAWYLRLERFADPRRNEVLERTRHDVARALEEAAAPELRHELKLMRAVVDRARAGREGPVEELLRCAQRCVELSRRTGAAHLCLDLVELGHAQRRAGNAADADSTFEEAASLARWIRLPRAEAFATGNRAGLAALQGDWLRSAQLAERALVGADHAYLRAVLELFCVVPLALAGRPEEVDGTLARVEGEIARVKPIDDEVAAALDGIIASLEGTAPKVAARARRLR